MTPDQVSIKWNNAATNDPCALCSSRTDPIVGWELFARDNFALVCHDCGEAIDPSLMDGLRVMQGIRADHPAEELPDGFPTLDEARLALSESSTAYPADPVTGHLLVDCAGCGATASPDLGPVRDIDGRPLHDGCSPPRLPVWPIS
jgi:hypothetical protein